jgi:pimeloyl-ACP methyl ester carboxylesterase
MNRRSALTLAAAATGTALAATQTAVAAAAPAGTITQARRLSYIERTDGTTLFYKDWGAGRPILFVHGAGINSDSWGYQMVPLVAHGFRCIAYDRRGHGRSSDIGHDYNFDTLADDLAAVMDVLDLHNVTLVAHSMGCAEVARYFSRHGAGRVSRIVMLAPTLPFLMKTEDNPTGVDKSAFEALRASWLRDYPKWVTDNAPPFFTPQTSPAMVKWGIDMAVQTSLQTAIQSNVLVVETDFRKELAKITVPTLILHGSKDVSCPLPLTGEPTAKLIRGCEFKVIDGAPHGLFLTHIEEINGELLRFARA